jgi:hypothetical protein
MQVWLEAGAFYPLDDRRGGRQDVLVVCTPYVDLERLA